MGGVRARGNHFIIEKKRPENKKCPGDLGRSETGPGGVEWEPAKPPGQLLASWIWLKKKKVILRRAGPKNGGGGRQPFGSNTGRGPRGRTCENVPGHAGETSLKAIGDGG